MSDDLDDFHDNVAIELDRRKIQKLIDDGIVTEEQLRNAQIVDLTDEPESDIS